MFANALNTACCYQSVKDKKFESNSQLSASSAPCLFRCYQSVKDKKFESNSQLTNDDVDDIYSCYQSVKDKKFESNSQHAAYGTALRNELLSVCQR